MALAGTQNCPVAARADRYPGCALFRCGRSCAASGRVEGIERTTSTSEYQCCNGARWRSFRCGSCGFAVEAVIGHRIHPGFSRSEAGLPQPQRLSGHGFGWPGGTCDCGVRKAPTFPGMGGSLKFIAAERMTPGDSPLPVIALNLAGSDRRSGPASAARNHIPDRAHLLSAALKIESALGVTSASSRGTDKVAGPGTREIDSSSRDEPLVPSPFVPVSPAPVVASAAARAPRAATTQRVFHSFTLPHLPRFCSRFAVFSHLKAGPAHHALLLYYPPGVGKRIPINFDRGDNSSSEMSVRRPVESEPDEE